MSKVIRWGLVILAALLVLWLMLRWMQARSDAQFSVEKLEKGRDQLVQHNANFLGRDRIAARFKLTLKGARGYTSFAAMRLPQTVGKVPALIVLHDLPSDTAFFKLAESTPRANELVFIGLNVKNCFGAPTTETMNVYGAAQLCIDYAYKHMAIDTNRIFVSGLGAGNLYALPTAYLDKNDVRGLALTLTDVVGEANKVIEGAKWAQPQIQDSVLVLSASPGELAAWQNEIGALPKNSFVKQAAGDANMMLRTTTEWLLGPRRAADSTAITPDNVPAAQVQKLQMK